MLIANVNSTKTDRDPSLSASGLELYFSSFRDTSQNGEIYVASRATPSGPFGNAVPLTIVNSVNNELAPDLTGDGLELYFERVGTGIMVAKRVSPAAAWSAPQPTGLNGRFPSVSADGLTLYMSLPNCMPGCMATSTRVDRTSPWSAPVAFALPGGLRYQHIDVSADGKKLILGSPGNPGAATVLVATRPDLSSDWTAVENIPALSFITSHEGPSWGAGDVEIYLSARNVAGAVGEDDLVVSVLE